MKDILENISLLETNLEKLPGEIQRHLFGFFNQKELKTISAVNKNFQKHCSDKIKELAKQHKSNVCYTVGIPIQFSDNDTSHYLYDLDRNRKYREKISLREIYDSFSGTNVENIKLFEKEDDAYEYSRFLRTGSHLYDGDDSFQPAVFKVIYLNKINFIEKKMETLIINRGCRSNIYDLNERTSNIEFFEAKRIDVMPLAGTLKIHSNKKDVFRNYGTIDYSSFNLNQEVNYFEFKNCTIS